MGVFRQPQKKREKRMGLLKLFGKKSPEDTEKKGDALFESGEYGLAKMEYEDALDRSRRAAQENAPLEERLKEKLLKTKEALALKHKEEGLEILDSEYYEAAEESFRLALELTQNPELIEEIHRLLSEIGDRVGETHGFPAHELGYSEDDPDELAEPPTESDEYFIALCSTLPEPVRKEFHQYGEAFKEGYLALNAGNFELAVEKLLQAMEEQSEGDFIALELATAYLNLERYQEARALAEKFLRAHPDHIQGYHILCEILWSLEEFDQAMTWLESSPKRPAESVTILLLQGETLLRNERWEEAVHLYEKALNSLGWQPDIARSLAAAYEVKGKREEARDLFGKLVAECRTCGSEKDTFSKQRFADLSIEMGEYSSNVLELYLSLVQENPAGRGDYYQKISRIYAAQGNSEEANRFERLAHQVHSESSDPTEESSERKGPGFLA
jgi:tetratricopeptide (TPR) repeat protein